MHLTRQLALALGTAMLSIAVLAGIAAAALTPSDAQASAEEGKPPLAKIEGILGKLVAEGKLSGDQGAMIIERLKQGAAAATEKAKGPSWKRALAEYVRTAATLLGMTESDVSAALREGQSLADLAAAKGRSRAELIAAIATAANAKVDEALAANTITAERATTVKAGIAKHVEALVDRRHEAKPAPKPEKKQHPLPKVAPPGQPKTP